MVTYKPNDAKSYYIRGNAYRNKVDTRAIELKSVAERNRGSADAAVGLIPNSSIFSNL